MRTFLVYSQNAQTSPNIKDLKSSGRIDILLHSMISSLYASNEFRTDVELHLYLMGQPNPPRHITIRFDEKNTLSKKNLKKIIEISLKKCKPGRQIEVHPGVFVDDYLLEKTLEEFKIQNKKIFMLDPYGEHIKQHLQSEFENPVFILGDHDGFEKQIKKFLKKNTHRISLGQQVYFTSQAITILNYELDNLN